MSKTQAAAAAAAAVGRKPTTMKLKRILALSSFCRQVPIYILVLSFVPKEAIPLSNVTVLGSALANLLFNIPKRHPSMSVNRPLIDWNLILLMEPLTLSGALFGTTLNLWLPDIVLVVSLVLLLSMMGYKTWSKAIQLYQQEQQATVNGTKQFTKGAGQWQSIKVVSTTTHGTDDDQDDDETEFSISQHSDTESPASPVAVVGGRQPQSQQPVMSPPKSSNSRIRRMIIPPLPSPEKDEEVTVLVSMDLIKDGDTQEEENAEEGTSKLVAEETSVASSSSSLSLTIQQKQNEHMVLLQQILQEESTPPYQSIAIMTGLFVFVLCINLLKGGSGSGSTNYNDSPIGVHCGSFLYWVLDGLIFVATNGVTWYARSYLLQQGQQKAQVNYPYLETDIQWNEQSTFIYPAMCSLAGVVAGLFGIGGGLVKAPLMLALGVHPTVASATCATMILFTSLTATTSFVVYGMLIWDYGMVCFCIGFIATLIGQLGMTSIIQRTGRSSYIAFCITGVVILSTITMSVEWGVAIASSSGDGDSSANHSFRFSFCEAP
jgi:uncharacterized membrane protein YfcA